VSTSEETNIVMWKFVRGDTSVSDFEEWVYSESSLEELLGEDLYMKIISANNSDKSAIWDVRKLLREYLDKNSELLCKCVTLSDSTVLGMGSENADEAFETLVRRKERGMPFWWLLLYQCSKCQQWWLVGQEERHNDDFCLQRLKPDIADKIMHNNDWPDTFDKYETMLHWSHEAGHSVRFDDPMNSSLLYTVEDLARERPGIAISELAKLLNLDIPLATAIAKKVIRNEKVDIDFKA